MCLDGSSPAYHLDRGSGGGAANWLLQFEVTFRSRRGAFDEDFLGRGGEMAVRSGSSGEAGAWYRLLPARSCQLGWSDGDVGCAVHVGPW